MWIVTLMASALAMLIATQGALFSWRPGQSERSQKAERERVVAFLFASDSYATGVPVSGSGVVTSGVVRNSGFVPPGAKNSLDSGWNFVRNASGEWAGCVTASSTTLSNVASTPLPFSQVTPTFKITRTVASGAVSAVISTSGADTTKLAALETLCP
jgi:hypothetical protein